MTLPHAGAEQLHDKGEMLMLLDDYAQILTQTIEQIRTTQREKILSAARITADSLGCGGLIRVFGCGHSHILAEETFYRAGGLAAVSPIFYEPLMLHESASESSYLEKQEGLAEKVFETVRYGENDVLFCVSTSGINAVPVEFAKMTLDAGIPVIGISSDAYLSDPARNALGLHLQQACTLCVNNFAPHGDACLKPEGWQTGMTPVSTVASTYIINSVLAESVRMAAEDGVNVPLYVSGNISGGAERNKALIEAFKPRISCL